MDPERGRSSTRPNDAARLKRYAPWERWRYATHKAPQVWRCLENQPKRSEVEHRPGPPAAQPVQWRLIRKREDRFYDLKARQRDTELTIHLIL